MENTYKETVSLLATIEHLMVANGLIEFKATEELQPIESEELTNYLSIKDREDPDLCTIEDKVTEMKIATCILRYLHKNQPVNSKEYNEQICQGALTIIRVLKLQLWRAKREINEEQYKQLLRKQKRAEVLAEAKYRVQACIGGAGAGTVAGLVIWKELQKIGIILDPQTSGVVIAVCAGLGLLLGLFLPKEYIELLKRKAKEKIIPLLQDYLDKEFEKIKVKLPQELSRLVESWWSKLKEILVHLGENSMSEASITFVVNELDKRKKAEVKEKVHS